MTEIARTETWEKLHSLLCSSHPCPSTVWLKFFWKAKVCRHYVPRIYNYFYDAFDEARNCACTVVCLVFKQKYFSLGELEEHKFRGDSNSKKTPLLLSSLSSKFRSLSRKLEGNKFWDVQIETSSERMTKSKDLPKVRFNPVINAIHPSLLSQITIPYFQIHLFTEIYW